MNRIVLIGNGFDLAHGLNTSYKNFIDWYWKDWGERLLHGQNKTEADGLCSFKLKESVNLANWAYVWGFHYQRKNPFAPWDLNDVINIAKEDKELCDYRISPFLQQICKSIETKNWVDIENEYYYLLKKYAIEESAKDKLHELNLQLQYLQSRLTEYLMKCQLGASVIRGIWEKIYSPIKISDISIAGQTNTHEHIQKWWLIQDENVLKEKANRYNDETLIEGVNTYKYNLEHNIYNMEYPRLFMLPDIIMLLNFNYTNTADMYSNNMVSFVNHIHGVLEKPESMIFGYGDELDDNFKKLLDSNENECLRNVKSIKYQESDNYRNVLAFIESASFQVCIMGHS